MHCLRCRWWSWNCRIWIVVCFTLHIRVCRNKPVENSAHMTACFTGKTSSLVLGFRRSRRSRWETRTETSKWAWRVLSIVPGAHSSVFVHRLKLPVRSKTRGRKNITSSSRENTRYVITSQWYFVCDNSCSDYVCFCVLQKKTTTSVFVCYKRKPTNDCQGCIVWSHVCLHLYQQLKIIEDALSFQNLFPEKVYPCAIKEKTREKTITERRSAFISISMLLSMYET